MLPGMGAPLPARGGTRQGASRCLQGRIRATPEDGGRGRNGVDAVSGIGALQESLPCDAGRWILGLGVGQIFCHQEVRPLTCGPPPPCRSPRRLPTTSRRPSGALPRTSAAASGEWSRASLPSPARHTRAKGCWWTKSLLTASSSTGLSRRRTGASSPSLRPLPRRPRPRSRHPASMLLRTLPSLSPGESTDRMIKIKSMHSEGIRRAMSGGVVGLAAGRTAGCADPLLGFAAGWTAGSADQKLGGIHIPQAAPGEGVWTEKGWGWGGS